jgi:hypothetical protein
MILSNLFFPGWKEYPGNLIMGNLLTLLSVGFPFSYLRIFPKVKSSPNTSKQRSFSSGMVSEKSSLIAMLKVLLKRNA